MPSRVKPTRVGVKLTRAGTSSPGFERGPRKWSEPTPVRRKLTHVGVKLMRAGAKLTRAPEELMRARA
jgi:hypothetical protein